MAKLNRRRDTQRDYIAGRAARMYIEGRSHGDIARELNTSPGKVLRLIEQARAGWLHDASIDVGAAKAKELAKLDAIEAESWAAWYRSVGQMSERTTSDKGERVRRWREAGDPKYLTVIQRCVEQRCRILGLNASEKHEHEHSGTLTHFLASLYGNHGTNDRGPGTRSDGGPAGDAAEPCRLPGPTHD